MTFYRVNESPNADGASTIHILLTSVLQKTRPRLVQQTRQGHICPHIEPQHPIAFLSCQRSNNDRLQ